MAGHKVTRAIWAMRIALASWAVVLLLAAAACWGLCSCASNKWVVRPRQADAEAIVWRQAYGEKNRAPAVGWVTTGLTCAKGTGWAYAQSCVSGQFSGSTWAIAVAWPSGNASFAPTAYAHELLHAHLFALTGNEDAGHTRPEWTTVLPAANAALAAAGL